MNAGLTTSCGKPLDQAEYDALIDTVAARERVAHHDAEDALQDAFVKAVARRDELEASGPLAGWVVSRASLNARSAKRTRAKTRVGGGRYGGALSLDGLRAGATERGVDPDAHVGLIAHDPLEQVDARLELERVLPARLRSYLIAAALAGGDGRVRRRGAASNLSRISDDDVDRIRAELAAGAGLRATARRYGLDHSTVAAIRDRRSRAAPTCPGWDADLALDAFIAFHRIHGRWPGMADCAGNPALPSHGYVKGTLGGWRRARALASARQVGCYAPAPS